MEERRMIGRSGSIWTIIHVIRPSSVSQNFWAASEGGKKWS